MEPFYRTSFARHLHSVVVNGFWERYIDADDYDFLEYVKRHGSANGNLPSSDAVLLEELEFWHLPYTKAPGIERRVGRRPRPVRDTLETRQTTWNAKRAIREHERAIAEAELQRERREWEAAKQNRKLRELLSDREWEEAAPWKPGHYEQWKLDREKKHQAAVAAAKAKALIHAKRAAEEQRQREEQEQLHRQELGRAQQEQRAWQQEQQEIMRKRREALIEQARKTIDQNTRAEREWQGPAYTTYYPDADSLKQAILTLVKSTGQPWTPDQIRRTLGCTNEAYLNQCLNQMLRDKQLWKAKKAESA